MIIYFISNLYSFLYELLNFFDGLDTLWSLKFGGYFDFLFIVSTVWTTVIDLLQVSMKHIFITINASY